MIIIDNNQIILAAIFATIRNGEVDEDILRHLVLNTYRMYRNKFKNKYGELVIANDSPDCWRRDIFPNYKASRRKDQKESKFDWNVIYKCLNTIREEVEETFPFKNITVDRAEADDIIGILAKQYHLQENIVIVSNDKDFQQLQRYPNVKQYSPLKKSFLVCDDPERFLVDHIIKGDVSDGIPNILSDDDVFVAEGKRQTGCGNKKVEMIREELHKWTENRNYDRNNRMINLNMIPNYIEEEVLSQFNKTTETDGSKILSYFIEKRLRNLMENIQEFV
jgi:hypothetical protein